MQRTRFNLDEERIPRAWLNPVADLADPLAPMLHPATRQPMSVDDMSFLFARALAEQEFSTAKEIEIPEPVRDVYRIWRPTPLVRAVRLERELQTPAHIYFKYEGASPVGSHKSNSAVAQAFFNREEGVKAMTTETGAGQWGTALSMGCRFFGIDLEIYMVKSSYHQKPYRRCIMENFGARVFASPSTETHYGRSVLEKDPGCGGSLGIAISEAVEVAARSGGQKKYGLGSVLNHVLLHQTVIGMEALEQMALAGEYPDVLVGCVGGGSNFGGFVAPFLRHDRERGTRCLVLAVEPEACPSLTQGELRYDFGDTAEMAPMLRMHTLGHEFMPPSLHAGGLRYHGMSPIVSAWLEKGLIEARAVPQDRTFEAAVLFSHCEGILPAPESSHAIRVAIDEALACREKGEKKVIVFNLSGHGHFDMTAYDAYHRGAM